MKLKSFGCSFIWGSELPDLSKSTDSLIKGSMYSELTWPARLSRALNIGYGCYARPGCGNFFIANQCLDQLALNEPALYVINWTWIDRFDYINQDNSSNRWKTLRPNTSCDGQEQLADYYYRNLHSQYRDKLATLMHIKLCIDSLQQTGHEFIMTYVDDLMLETEWHTSPAVSTLQEYIRPHLRQFNGLNMLEYSREHGHAFGPQAHPLESAHEDLFQYALANFAVDKIKTA